MFIESVLAFLKEYHADVVSWLAIILTVIQWSWSIYRNRASLDTVLENIDQENMGPRKECVIVFSVVNTSTAPINITRVMLRDGESWISSRLRHAPVFIHNWPTFPETDIPRSERTFSTDFPVHLEARGAVNIIAIFTRDISTDDFTEGELIRVKFVTDKKDVECELRCKIYSRERLAEYY